jgi:transposase
MAKRYRVTLTTLERAQLEEIISKRSSNSVEVKRSYILLAADENGDKAWKDTEIQSAYGSSISTIERVRQRFVEDGLSIVLKGKSREVFKEKVLDGEVEAKLISLRCSSPPDGYNKWTLRLLADKMVCLEYVDQISYESVRQLLKKQDEALAGQELGNPHS